MPLISSADSIDLGCWSSPDALERIVTGFAEQFRHACFLQDQFVAIDWKLAPCFALPSLQRLNAIIKPIDCHTAFAIMKRGEQLRERGDWIGDGTSKNTGMQIHLRTGHFDLESGYSTQPVAQCWHAALDHSGI